MAQVFTDAQINEILNIFKQHMGHRQYIGARYVPIFGRKGEESILWDNSAPYEPLTIVLYQGNSYTSRQYVPAGIEITNNEFWAETGNYNAQIEQYRQEVLDFDDRITANTEAIEDANETFIKYQDVSIYKRVVLEELAHYEFNTANYTLGGAAYNDANGEVYIGLYRRGTDAEAQILVFDHDDILSTGASISPKKIIPLGRASHMNGMHYYEGKIYVCAWRNDIAGNGPSIDVNIVSIADDSVTTVQLPAKFSIANIGIVVDDFGVVTIAALYDHYSKYAIWKVIGDEIYPHSMLPCDIAGSNYAQDCAYSTTWIMQLYAQHNEFTNNEIYCNDWYGNTLYKFSFTNDIDEPEGIYRLPGSEYVFIATARGKFYKGYIGKLEYNQFLHTDISEAFYLRKHHMLTCNKTDFPDTAYEITNNTQNLGIVTKFIIPSARYIVNGIRLPFMVGGVNPVYGEVYSNQISLDVTLAKNISNVPYKFDVHLQYNGASVASGKATEYTLSQNSWANMCVKTNLANGEKEYYYGEAAFNAIPATVVVTTDWENIGSQAMGGCHASRFLL